MIQAHEKGLEAAKLQALQTPHDHTNCLNFKQLEAVGQLVAAYIANGWKLCPIPPGGKGPKAKDWNTPGAALVAADDLPPGYGVGLLHAFSGTVALDIDAMTTAAPLLLAAGVDLQALLDAPDAVQIVSGRPNRAKLLFSLPPFLRLPSVKANGPDGATSFEIRCGTSNGLTVQDVLPPSMHPDGQPYRWAGAGHWSQLPPCPDALLSFWATLIPATDSTTPTTSASTVSDADWSLALDALQTIPPDCSRDAWTRSGMALHSSGRPDAFDVWSEWSKGSPDKYPGSVRSCRSGTASRTTSQHRSRWPHCFTSLVNTAGNAHRSTQPGYSAPWLPLHPLALRVPLRSLKSCGLMT